MFDAPIMISALARLRFYCKSQNSIKATATSTECIGNSINTIYPPIDKAFVREYRIYA